MPGVFGGFVEVADAEDGDVVLGGEIEERGEEAADGGAVAGVELFETGGERIEDDEGDGVFVAVVVEGGSNRGESLPGPAGMSEGYWRVRTLSMLAPAATRRKLRVGSLSSWEP